MTAAALLVAGVIGLSLLVGLLAHVIVTNHMEVTNVTRT